MTTPEESAQHRAYYAKHRERLLAKAKAYAQQHAEKIQAYQREYGQAHAEALKDYRRVYYTEHRDTISAQNLEYAQKRRLEQPEQVRAIEKVRYDRWRKRNPEDVKFFKRRTTKRQRLEMFSVYGTRCACCGEGTYEFLTLDHTNGDGAAHRKSVWGTSRGVSTSQMYAYLKAHGWPKDGFRTLCMNCNWATRHRQPCPHTLQDAAEDWAAVAYSA